MVNPTNALFDIYIEINDRLVYVKYYIFVFARSE